MVAYSFLNEYDIELDRIIGAIREYKPSKILLQIPDGFKKYYTIVVEAILKRLQKEDLPVPEIILDADPNYGSCMIRETACSLTDLVIHMGHTEYPWQLASGNKPSCKIIYVPLEYKLLLYQEIMNDILEIIKHNMMRQVGILASIQHKKQLEQVSNFLKNRGIYTLSVNPFYKWGAPGQILGCELSAALAMKNKVDGFLVISSGLFHALGVSLATGKKTIKVDPYTGVVEDMDPHTKRFLRIRYYKITEAMKAKNWGLIHGETYGQYRPWLRNLLIRKMRDKGYKVYEFLSSILLKDFVLNIDTSDIEAYVITSCPRLALEDLSSLEKPVLTPGETFMILENRLEPYRFPW